jgi:hypothetical protein
MHLGALAADPGFFPFDDPIYLVPSDSRETSVRHFRFDILRQALTPPRKFSALPPADYREASPKAVSRRTSYLRVRLEFLPYPPLIATLFNGCAFGPPRDFTPASSWPWVDHPVSGLPVLTRAHLRLGFPPAPRFPRLTSPVPAARRTVLQKVCGRAFALPPIVNIGFQVLFHSPPGVLFTFPSQYSALSVTEEYLALGGGPPGFPQGFPCLAVLWIPAARFRLRVRGSHPYRRLFQNRSTGFFGT